MPWLSVSLMHMVLSTTSLAATAALPSVSALAAADEGAESAWLANIEQAINSGFAPISELASTIIFFPLPLPGGNEIPFVLLWLIGWAVFITFYFGFIQFRGLKVAWEVVRGRYSSPNDPGEITHFQALTSAVSGTVGLGNIAGVAVAVTLGGPGATFWMILAGLLGMATKFAECTLGVRYRRIDPDGTVHGGAFHYLPVAFERFGSVISKALTGLFAIAILFFGGAGGNMFQSNQTYQIVRDASGGDDSILASDGGALVFGLLLAAGVGLVIIGGVKSIGRVTSKLVPAMAIVYVLSCLAVILINIGHVPDALGQIFAGAFTPEGVTGGMIGVIIQGFRRAAFSNEAGLGSAPIAHSAVKTRRPVSEGFVALWEPFIDTVVICTMTALTIVIAQPQAWLDARQSPDAPAGVTITAAAFDTFLPRWDIVLAVCVFLFAFSTVITWAYYSQQAWRYLFGRTRIGDLVFKIVYLFFTTIGAVLTLGAVLDFADSFLFVCAFVNLLGVGLLLPVIKQEMRDYLRDRKAGTLLQLGDDSVETVNEGRAE